jgi:hypothetical protein
MIVIVGIPLDGWQFNERLREIIDGLGFMRGEKGTTAFFNIV